MQHNRFYDTSIKNRIVLNEKLPPPKEHQIMKIGLFNHQDHGPVEITKQVLADMVKNFNEKVRGVDIAWDYFHEFNGVASGWPVRLELRNDGAELWAETEWTPEAQKKLSERELRYFSPDFAFQWTHPETNLVYQNVLFGGALTNRPFLKEMQAIVASEGGMNKDEEIQMGGPGSGPQGGGAGKPGAGMKVGSKEWRQARRQAQLTKSNTSKVAFTKKSNAIKQGQARVAAQKTQSQNVKEIKEIKRNNRLGLNETQGVNMDEKEKQIETLENQIAELMDKLDALKGEQVGMSDANKALTDQNKTLSDENKMLSEKVKKAEDLAKTSAKENEFNVLLSEGKACVAQKEAYLKNDMTEFIRLSEKTNTKANGASGGNSSDATGDEDEQIIKLAEEKVKANSSLQFSEAVKDARREIKAKSK